MAVSVDYVVRETASNLWRNRLMTIAAILTVAVSLSLVGAALLLRQGSANATGTLERGTQVTVWMRPDANAQEISAVGTELSQLNYVDATLRLLEQGPQLRRGPPPAALGRLPGHDAGRDAHLLLVHPRCADRRGPGACTRSSGTAGVLSVTEPQQTIKNEETVINVSKWVCLAVAIVLIVSAAVLILNTIRMAIFARRREVSVMKLVGATNWFIRVPFMSEGLLQGFIGSMLAAVVVYFVYLFIDHEGSGRTTSNIFTAMHMTGSAGLAHQRGRRHRGHGHRLHRLGHRHPALPRRLASVASAAGVGGRTEEEAHRASPDDVVGATVVRGGQCAMAQSMSGLRVRGATAASTSVTRPLRT